jgi:hypothetical protein
MKKYCFAIVSEKHNAKILHEEVARNSFFAAVKTVVRFAHMGINFSDIRLWDIREA